MTQRPWVLLRLGCVTSVIALLTALSAGPSSAQEDGSTGSQLQLSSDGTAYGPTLGRALFPDSPLLVPGESISDRFWARNESDEPAVLSLYAVSARSSLPEGVAPDDDFQVAAVTSGRPTSPTPVGELDECVPITRVGLAPGQNTEIDLEVALPETAGNIAQSASVRLGFVVDLRPGPTLGQRCGVAPAPDPVGPGTPEGPGNPGAPDHPDAPGPSPDPGAVPGVAPDAGAGAVLGIGSAVVPGSMPSVQPGWPPASPGSGPLPRTGGDVLPALLVGLLAVAIGAALRRAGRDPATGTHQAGAHRQDTSTDPKDVPG